MDIYRDSMLFIHDKVALASIRKVIRMNNLSDKEKLQEIIAVVHEYEFDMKEKPNDAR